MNKKGTYDWTTQVAYWGVKLLFAVIVGLVIAVIVSSWVTREVDTSSTEAEILFTRVESCLERNSFELNDEVRDCLGDSNYGINITKDNKEFIINEELYDLTALCKFREYSCFSSVTFDDMGNSIDIGVVVKNA